jgi:hypothetical protein
MKEDLVIFETRFNHRFFLKDEEPAPEDWTRSKLKELVTSEYAEQMAGYNQHQRFSEVLRAMGFVLNKAEVENNTVYVVDLLIAARNPKEIVQALEERHKFRLKEDGPLTYNSGCDYLRDQDGTLCFGQRKYITKMMDEFKNMYGNKPKEYTSPLEIGDHPKVDTSEELDEEGIKKYQR